MPKIQARVEVEGVAEVKGNLRKVIEKASEDELVDAIEPAAEIVRRDAERNAPRDRGILADEIIKDIRVLAAARVVIGISWSEQAFYGIFHEIGWTDKGGTYHAPDPFLRPALSKNRPRVKAIIRQNLKDLIQDF